MISGDFARRSDAELERHVGSFHDRENSVEAFSGGLAESRHQLLVGSNGTRTTRRCRARAWLTSVIIWLFFVHAGGVPLCPWAGSQLCTPLPLHCVWPGAHTPVQIPLMQVWLVHATGLPQLPLPPHSCVELPTHCFEPGEHSTHVLCRHAGALPVHVVWGCQLPVASHDWMLLPRQRVWPGAQRPVHAPLMQVWFEQAAPLVQVPLALHVCGVFPLHRTWDGAQTPVHVPLTQV